MRLALPATVGRLPSANEKLLAVLASTLLLLAVGAVDEMTGEHVLVDAFYMLPILVATWFLGLRGGMAFALLTTITCALVWIYGRGFPALGVGLSIWNALMRLSVMATVAYLLSRARHEGFTLRDALDRTRALPDVIPMCAWCRKLRGERDEWQTLEEFLTKETDVLLTHCVCNECAEQLREETRAEMEARSAHPERS